MSTTTRPTKATRARSARPDGTTEARRPRVRASARGAAADIGDASDGHEKEYDLLTAALLGAALGAGTTLLLRRGPSGSRPIAPAWRVARAGARRGARLAERGARAAWDRGVDAWERVPREEIQDRLGEYFDTARSAIERAVESEIKDLRRAMRRRRKKLGL